MADDFISDGRPVVAVRWWGSYLGEAEQRPTSFVGPFHIGFHLSTAREHPFSLPLNPPLVLHLDVTAQEEFVGTDAGGDSVYRYDAYLPLPFNEVAGTEYFIAIDWPGHFTGAWGWHETSSPIDVSSPILDWAAVGQGHVGSWSTFIPETNLAFELMTEPGTEVPASSPFGLVVLVALLSAAALWSFRKRRQRGCSGAEA